MIIWDTFMFGRELDVLEMRLYELQDVPNLKHVIVEANVDHQDHPKPSFYLDNRERFSQWAERIVHVWATGLPTASDFPDPWAREHAQREWAANGLIAAGCENDDVILHGDCDEIPTPLVVRNVRPRGFVAFDQRLFCFAVDWEHPGGWRGTVASRASNVRTFAGMRDSRNMAPALFNAGWHLSWLGSPEDNRAKLNSFCHPEVRDQIDYGLQDGKSAFYELGLHVDGTKMRPVDVDGSWPRWVAERKCPANWFRPRGGEVAA